jgi:hypothetical protein
METKKTQNGTDNRVGIISFPKGIQRFPDNGGAEDNPGGGGNPDPNAGIDISHLTGAPKPGEPAAEPNQQPQLSEEQKELLTKYSGSSFDETGNVLDAAGKVIKTKDEIAKETASASASGADQKKNDTGTGNPGDNKTGDNPNPDNDSVDDVDAWLDDNGNLVDSEGVIATKDQLAKDGRINAKGDLIDPATGEVVVSKEQMEAAKVTAANTPDLITTVINKEGYTFNDENGKPKTYTNDIEGIATYYRDVAAKIALDAQQEFLSSNPQIRDFARHILAGGTADSYYNRIKDDYSSVEFDKLTPEQVDEAVKVWYKKKNIDAAVASNMIKSMKDADSYKDFSKTAIEELGKIKKLEDEAEVKKIADARQKELDDSAAYWDKLSKLVQSGTLDNVSIPEAEKKTFWDYLTVPVDKEGRSQELVDRIAMKEEDELRLAYLRFKKWDIKSLVTTEANKRKVLSLRKHMAEVASGGQNDNSRTKNDRQGTGTPQITGLKVEQFLPQNTEQTN